CDKLLLSIWIPPLLNNAVGEPNIIIALEVLYCKLKQLQPPAQQVVYLFSKVPFFGSTKNGTLENRALP
ncbi:hypothetical protein, partial [Dorea sp.]